MSNDSPPLLRAAIMMTVSAISLFPVFPPIYLTSGVLWNGLFGWGLLMGLIGQVIPFLFLLISIPRIGGRMAGILGSIELPVTVFVAYLILSESCRLDSLVWSRSDYYGNLYQRVEAYEETQI